MEKQINPVYPYAVQALRREIARLNALVEDLQDLIIGMTEAQDRRPTERGCERKEEAVKICEYSVTAHSKSGRVLCSLTGGVCFCEDLPASCLRRIFAAQWDAKQVASGRKVEVICSEDNPKPPV